MIQWMLLIIILMTQAIGYCSEPLQAMINVQTREAQNTSTTPRAEDPAPGFVNMSVLPARDPDCSTNLSALSHGQTQVEDRTVTYYFMPGSRNTPQIYFGVSRAQSPQSFFYDFDCNLIAVSERDNNTYPSREEKRRYPSGTPVSATVHISDQEALSYSPDGHFLGVWKKGVFMIDSHNNSYYP